MKFGIEIVCDSQRRRIGIEQVVTIPENRFREHIRRILRRRCREKQHNNAYSYTAFLTMSKLELNFDAVCFF